jgi:hypothetical protein
VAATPSVVTRNATASDGSDTSGGSYSSNNTIATITPTMTPALVLRGQYDFVSESNSLDVWGNFLLNGDCQGTHGTVIRNTRPRQERLIMPWWNKETCLAVWCKSFCKNMILILLWDNSSSLVYSCWRPWCDLLCLGITNTNKIVFVNR